MPKYDVRNYGAVGDGVTVVTSSIQAAIDQCHKDGGGTVLLEAGHYVCGTLFLRSNVELHIHISATLVASGNIEHYSSNTHYNRYVHETDMDPCFIYAEDAENIAISGLGEIEGNAEAFPNKGSIYRPMMIRLLRCHNVRVSNLRLTNAAAWTTAFLDSSHIWAEGLTIKNTKKLNGDGLDFDGCHHVYVSNCYIEGTDDNLCLQAGSQQYPVHDIHISNCSFTSICAGIRIGLKSVGDIFNVTVNNCTFHKIWREGVKIECTEGGSISDITMTNLLMRNVRRPLFILLNNRFAEIGSSIGLTSMPPIGIMERIRIIGLTATDDNEMAKTHFRFEDDVMGSPRFNGIKIDAANGHPIRKLHLRDLVYTSYGGVKISEIPSDYPEVVDLQSASPQNRVDNYWPDWSRAAFLDIRNVSHLKMDNLIFESTHPDERPPVIIENCEQDT